MHREHTNEILGQPLFKAVSPVKFNLATNKNSAFVSPYNFGSGDGGIHKKFLKINYTKFRFAIYANSGSPVGPQDVKRNLRIVIFKCNFPKNNTTFMVDTLTNELVYGYINNQLTEIAGNFGVSDYLKSINAKPVVDTTIETTKIGLSFKEFTIKDDYRMEIRTLKADGTPHLPGVYTKPGADFFGDCYLVYVCQEQNNPYELNYNVNLNTVVLYEQYGTNLEI